MNYTKNVQYYRYIVTCISEMYDISSITYNVQITGFATYQYAYGMDSEKILTGLNDSGLTQQFLNYNES